MTLEQIQKDYNELAQKREQITIEMYRLEGAGRLLQSQLKEESKVDDVLEETKETKETKTE